MWIYGLQNAIARSTGSFQAYHLSHSLFPIAQMLIPGAKNAF